MAHEEPEKEDVWTGLGHFLEGLVFPARPVDMVRHAEQQRRQDRIHQEIMARLERLPDRHYESPEEVRAHLKEEDKH